MIALHALGFASLFGRRRRVDNDESGYDQGRRKAAAERTDHAEFIRVLDVIAASA
jgi:hypothetical protein